MKFIEISSIVERRRIVQGMHFKNGHTLRFSFIGIAIARDGRNWSIRFSDKLSCIWVPPSRRRWMRLVINVKLLRDLRRFLVCAFLLYIKYLETSSPTFLPSLIRDVVEASLPSSRGINAGSLQWWMFTHLPENTRSHLLLLRFDFVFCWLLILAFPQTHAIGFYQGAADPRRLKDCPPVNAK
jgi:hypothetical protein